jgi:hypothetical protein
VYFKCVTVPHGVSLRVAALHWHWKALNYLVEWRRCWPAALRIAAILQTMNVASRGDAIDNGDPLSFDDGKRSAVISELERIVAGEAFRTSKRSRQFLFYVVRQTLEGNGELLKERTIGADVFGRGPEGITTENSLVYRFCFQSVPTFPNFIFVLLLHLVWSQPPGHL